MGYGFGGFLIVVGLVLALAVQDKVDAVDLTMVGWIMAGVGVVVIGLAVATNFDRGRVRSTTTTTHRDGTQTVQDQRTDMQ